MRLETLAYLIRRAQNGGPAETELLENVVRQLMPRVRVIAKTSAGGWLADDDWEDIGQEGLTTMVQGLAKADGEEPTYWEVNFWNAFKLDCIDALRALRTKVAREAKSFEDLPQGDDGPPFEALMKDPIDQLTKREILAILSPEEARAFALAYFEGLQVRGGEGTVMGLMGKSREMIYKHLRSAKAKIRADSRFESWIGRR